MDATHKNTESGRYTATEHAVFPGIRIAYYSSHVQNAIPDADADVTDQVFEIFHCREGRMECNIGADYCYISPGDLLIAKTNRISPSFCFPLHHYHGITIRIDTETAPKCLSCFLRDVAVQPKRIAEKFCGEKDYFIARSNSSVEHIFSELYNVPDEIQQGYFKIKILELMLFLSVFDASGGASANRSISQYQVDLAKDVAKHLTENMDEKFTLEQAANKFHVSATNIKNAFKAVYGVSYYAFIKTQKMESAAYMLEYSDKPIIEIANAHGYDNSSKFASAFRAVKGMAPREYRAVHQKSN